MPQPTVARRGRARTSRAPAALAFAALVALASAAAAQDEAEEPDYAREGPYLGIHGFGLIEHARGDLRGVGDSGGLGASIGFRVAPALGVEIMGEWAYLEGRNPWSIGLQARLYPLPFFDRSVLDDRLQPYVLGFAGLQTGELGKGGQPGGNFRIGGGADFWLNEDIALTGNVVYSGSGGDPANLRSTNITLGALFRY